MLPTAQFNGQKKMIMKTNSLAKVRFFISGVIILSIMFLFQGCAQVVGPSADFVPVVVQPGETLATLAEKYLRDADKRWLIADFNEVTSVSAGQEILIPLQAKARGGLSPIGYQTVPILTYHNFSETKQDLMMVRKDSFEQQMNYLASNGYTVITLDDFFDFLEFRKQLPKKAVVITFDDGWQGVYTIALPILKKYGFPATLFVYTDLINGSKKTLSWSQLAELDREGIDIQGHTKTHRNLSKIKNEESLASYVRDVENEITASTRIIKEKLNKDVQYLAYPYGDTNNLIVAFLKKKGYRGAFTVKRDANPFFMDHYTLNRSMIYGGFDLRDFKKNLSVYSNKALN
jgi:peptidoglycan/xylan/chitin deacetylase (PgdA/CDA1 family)